MSHAPPITRDRGSHFLLLMEVQHTMWSGLVSPFVEAWFHLAALPWVQRVPLGAVWVLFALGMVGVVVAVAFRLAESVMYLGVQAYLGIRLLVKNDREERWVPWARALGAALASAAMQAAGGLVTMRALRAAGTVARGGLPAPGTLGSFLPVHTPMATLWLAGCALALTIQLPSLVQRSLLSHVR